MSAASYCPLCNFSAPTRSLWLSHIRNVHYQDDNFAIICGINGCSSKYNKCASFVSHVYRQHREAIISQVNQTNSTERSDTTETDCDAFCHCEYEESHHFDDHSLPHTVNQILGTDYEEQKKRVLCTY